jgi:hypothetical protein
MTISIISKTILRASGKPNSSKKARSSGLLASIISLFILSSASAQYISRDYQTDLYFGLHSQWVQPWRGYLETVPATRFLDGVGVVLKSPNRDLVCEMLAKHGITVTRIEINWGALNMDDTITQPQIISALEACKKWEIRPIILLNANEGLPCPAKVFSAVAAKTAPAHSTSVTFTDTTGFVPGKTGISNLTGYSAAEILVTAVNGNEVSLSKPLPQALTGGHSVRMATLKYRPFSVAGSADYNQTMAGWKSYVLAVGKFATRYLGTGKFDLEVWNELTFGSSFLYINDYYDPPIAHYDENAIWAALVQATADVATANSSVFTGVDISDGFANTIPWPASSTEPARVKGISKHCYPVPLNFPAKEQKDSGELNALLQQEKPPKFVPTYNVYFPEYAGTAIQTETTIRDISPIPTQIYGVMHGRYARPGYPSWGWITECGYDPYYAGVTDPTVALKLKAKSTARFFCFFLNKGCQKVTIFSTAGGDARLGIVQDNFLAYTQSNTVYPTNDSPYTSPALAVTGHIVNQMRLEASPTTAIRQLGVSSVSAIESHAQFHGDGTLAHPDLDDSNVLTILPYQSNPHRFVIPYYVMTRNLADPLTPEPFTIALTGLNTATTKIECYDPMADTYYPVTVNSTANGTITSTVTAADYPYLLIVTD